MTDEVEPPSGAAGVAGLLVLHPAASKYHVLEPHQVYLLHEAGAQPVIDHRGSQTERRVGRVNAKEWQGHTCREVSGLQVALSHHAARHAESRSGAGPSHTGALQKVTSGKHKDEHKSRSLLSRPGPLGQWPSSP